jgi:hypothetical protein
MTVISWIDANSAQESPPHDLGAVEARLGGDDLDTD